MPIVTSSPRCVKGCVKYGLPLLILFFCLSCRPEFKTPRDTLVIGLEAAPITLDPRLASDAYSSKISRLIHQGLFRLNEHLEAVPDLVEKFESVGPLKYQFVLREGLSFSDGGALTAEDVKFTLESVRDPALPSPFRGAMEKIETIRVVNNRIFEITLKEPFSPFFQSLTLGIIRRGGENPTLGTGPFELESFLPSEEIALKRNGRYLEDPSRAPKISRVVFRIIPDDNLRVLELKKHRIDLVQNAVPPQLLKSLQQDSGLEQQTTEGINFSYLGINLQKDPLKSLDVRRAIAHALDIPAMIEYRMARMARPASSLLAPIHWAFEKGVEAYPYHPKKSRDLLDKAGYPDPDGGGVEPRFTVTYRTSTKKDRIGLARLVARYLKDVGIEVKILPFEWGTFFHDIQVGNFELFSLTWVGATEPDIYHYLYHSSQKPPEGANRGGYENPVIDRLTEEGRRLTDRSQRKEIYSLVQKLLAKDLPIIPLWYEDNYAVFSKRVKGVQLRPDASFDWVAGVYKE